MAILNDEATRLIDHIERTVRGAVTDQDKLGILEIVNQWRSDIEAGRQIERKLAVRQSPGLDVFTDTPRSRGTYSGDFVGKEDFTPIEQLDMLITALGTAFVAPYMMAERFLNAITEFSDPDTKGRDDPVVRLVGVGDVDEPKLGLTARISRGSVIQSREQTNALAALLHEISKEAGLSQRRLTDSEEFG